MKEEKKSLQIFQDRFEELERRVASKAKELDPAREEIKTLTTKLVDAKEKERANLIDERAQAVMLYDAVLAEYNDLQSRRDSAYLAIYEFRVSWAREVVMQWTQKSSQMRHSLDKALSELRIWTNGGRGKAKMSESEADKRQVELKINVSRIKAESLIINRDASRAGCQLEKALNELVAARQALGVNRAGKP